MDVLAGMDTGKIIAITLCVIAIIGAVFVAVRLLSRGKNLSTPVFKLTEPEKERVQAESRELSDNQMRTAKIHIGSIRMLMITEAERIFPGMTSLEQAYTGLLAGKITDNLLEQYRIDLVRNHIVKKSDEDLKIYTQAKASTYYTKIRLFLCDYNPNLPNYDLKKIIEGIPFKDIYDIYYESYLSAKQLSMGY